MNLERIHLNFKGIKGMSLHEFKRDSEYDFGGQDINAGPEAVPLIRGWAGSWTTPLPD